MDVEQQPLSIPYEKFKNVSESLEQIKRCRSAWKILAVCILILVVYGILLIVIFVLLSQINSKISYHNPQTANSLTQDNATALRCYCLKTNKPTTIPTEKTAIRKNGGWFVASNDHMYKKFNFEQAYQGAVKACLAVGGKLAATGIRNITVKKEIFDNLLDSPEKNVWIGLEFSGDKWVWSDGVETSLNDTDWAPGEPNNSWYHRCAELWGEHGWKLADGKCTTPHPYLCEVFNKK